MDRFLRWTGYAIIAFIAAPLIIVIPMSFSTSASLQFPPPGSGWAITSAISPIPPGCARP
jgi:hypothetical protein